MKIYDISQEVFGCEIYEGDPEPQKETVCSIEKGELYNLTSFSMCAHNGTHIDAPYHFFENGKKVEEIPLFKTVGIAFVAEHNGILNESDAHRILMRAVAAAPKAAKRILIKGEATVSLEAAQVFADMNIYLIGNESQSIGPLEAPMEVHKVLLGAETVLLEGIRLNDVPEGVYFLNAAPLSLGGCDGAPCRAILIELDNA